MMNRGPLDTAGPLDGAIEPAHRTPDQLAISLKELMDEMRAVRRTAAIDVNHAGYNADTAEINRAFLADMLEIIPVEPGYLDNAPHRTKPDKLIIADVEEVRVASSFTVHAPVSIYDQARPGLIVGERINLDKAREPVTDVLIAGWQRNHNGESKTDEASAYAASLFSPGAPTIHQFSVLTKQWDALRDQAKSRLSVPLAYDQLMGNYSEEFNSFTLTERSPLESIVTTQNRRNNLYGESVQNSAHTRRGIYWLNGAFSLENSEIPHIGNVEERALQSSDFTDFGVLQHTRLLAAAFNRSDGLEEIVDQRESVMPPHPVELTYGPKDLRTTLENGQQPQMPTI